jgi:hypothetical protein
MAEKYSGPKLQLMVMKGQDAALWSLEWQLVRDCEELDKGVGKNKVLLTLYLCDWLFANGENACLLKPVR